MGDRITFCPCCGEAVVTRDHWHRALEAIEMLTAKQEARCAA